MVNAYVVWLGLLCDGSCSLSSVDHCVNPVFLDSCFYEEFCYHHQSLLPEPVSCSRDLQRKGLPLLHLPVHFSLLLTHSSWTSTWQPFTLQSICSRNKQILQDPIELTLASLAALLVIFERLSSLAAYLLSFISFLLSVNSRHSGFWVQFELILFTYFVFLCFLH